MSDPGALTPLPAERFFEACHALHGGRSSPVLNALSPSVVACARQAGPRLLADAPKLPSPWGHYRRLGKRLAALASAQWPRALQIETMVAGLRQALRADPANTIAVLLPWGDSAPPAAPVDVAQYLRLARRLMVRYPGSRLWVQTTDATAWCQFRDTFGERCSNLWVADGSPSLGRTPVPGWGPAEWASPLQVADLQCAMWSLLAESRLVVTHTGYAGLWLCLSRGHARGIWQIDDQGLPINPDWPGGWWGACRGAWQRAIGASRRPSMASSATYCKSRVPKR